MPIKFTKFHGLGNDYIVLEAQDLSDVKDLGQFSKRICNRHYGAGSDGIAIVEKLDSSKADFNVRIFNPDGSVAGFSGNGTRCAAAYLYYKGIWSGPDLPLMTRSGLKQFHLIEEFAPGHYSFEAEIGKPLFAGSEVPVLTDGHRDGVVNEPIMLNGREFRFSAINVGNPVACVFVEEFSFDWRPFARSIESHEMFP